MTARAACWTLPLLLLAACPRSAPDEAPRRDNAPGPSVTLAAPAASSAPPAASAPASAAPGGEGTPELPAISPRCCRLDRTEGGYGPATGVHVSYKGDVLLRNDGGKLLFPTDLISDTKELYIFAKSAGRSMSQERRVRVVGEQGRLVSVAIEDHGDTGAGTPFVHVRCTTLDTKKMQPVALGEAVGEDASKQLLAEATRRFEATPGHERYRLVPASYALREGDVVFCCSARDDSRPSPRLDIIVPRPPSPGKLLLRR